MKKINAISASMKNVFVLTTITRASSPCFTFDQSFKPIPLYGAFFAFNDVGWAGRKYCGLIAEHWVKTAAGWVISFTEN